MRPSEWQSRGKTRTINGFRIFTVDEGEPGQETILLIHGFPTASWGWTAFMCLPMITAIR